MENIEDIVIFESKNINNDRLTYIIRYEISVKNFKLVCSKLNYNSYGAFSTPKIRNGNSGYTFYHENNGLKLTLLKDLQSMTVENYSPYKILAICKYVINQTDDVNGNILNELLDKETMLNKYPIYDGSLDEFSREFIKDDISFENY